MRDGRAASRTRSTRSPSPRAALREPRLSRPRPDEQPFRELKLLVDHREDLVDERRRAQQRLRWHLHQLDPSFVVPAQASRPAAASRSRRPLARTARAGRPGARRTRAGQLAAARSRARSSSSTASSSSGPRRRRRRCSSCPAAARSPPRSCSPRSARSTASKPTRNSPGTAASHPRSELRPRPTPPARPRRQPPTQRRLLPNRDHASPLPPGRARLPRTQTSRRQEPPRSDPLPQTTTRPRRLQHPQSEPRLDIGATPTRPRRLQHPQSEPSLDIGATLAQAKLTLRDIGPSATQLAHHCMALEARRRDCDLTPHEPVLARAHLRKEPGKRRQLGLVPHRAAHCRASGYMFGPDQVHRLVCDSQPAAGLTRDLDQGRTGWRQMIQERTADSD